MRVTVPRSQTTTRFATEPGSIGVLQSGSPYPDTSAAETTVLPAMPRVIVDPGRLSVVPSEARSWRVVMKALGPYDAPTVVTHGPACSAVPGPGPELPAEAFTSMPAAYASRKASSTGSENGSAPPLIEKLMTSTPSMTACWMALTESEL